MSRVLLAALLVLVAVCLLGNAAAHRVRTAGPNAVATAFLDEIAAGDLVAASRRTTGPAVPKSTVSRSSLPQMTTEIRSTDRTSEGTAVVSARFVQGRESVPIVISLVYRDRWLVDAVDFAVDHRVDAPLQPLPNFEQFLGADQHPGVTVEAGVRH